LLSLANISVQFGTKKLFEGVSFTVNLHDRIGLVGANGTGKSTLLKIMTGSLEPDSGEISISRHTTVDYLPQDGITYSGNTLYEEVYSGLTDIARVKDEIDEINRELENFTDKNSSDYLDLVENLGELNHRFEDLEGFKIRSKIEKILSGLGFTTDDFNRTTDEFSGGWQMRIALAKLLLKNPSILLLDEPTNHLDLVTLLWLEDFLRSYDGAVILVSHDRTFLDNITSKTIEIYTGKVTIYPGNYSYYWKAKEKRKELLEKRYLNQQNYLKQQERFIERFRYKATKASAVQSRIKMLEKIERIELEDEEQAINFNFPPATHSGKKIIELKNITKRFGDKLILNKLDLEIERGDKIGFVGINGAGKSTLARIMIGSEPFQEGERKQGYKVELEYYSQNQADSLEPNHTVHETLDEVATGDIRKQLRNILGSFLFKGDDVFKQVSVLSGGEKSRLALARMLLKPSNFLIMDEPTNHLDMNSKYVLMNALSEYRGTMLIISHDREFLDGIVNKIIEIQDKKIKTYTGNCSEYIIKKNEEESMEQDHPSLQKRIDVKQEILENKPHKTKEQKREEAELRNKIYKISKPYIDKIKHVEDEIKLHENTLKYLEKEMTSDTFYKDSEKVINATKELKELKAKLEGLYHQWMEYNSILINIESELTNHKEYKSHN
jgi:ATP-binding cassette subfamily F protein 3